MKRRKLNCLCRCTPRGGIESLTPSQLDRIFHQTLSVLDASRSPGRIAATGLRAGQLFAQTGHPWRALKLLEHTMYCVFNADENLAWDYAKAAPSFNSEWYIPWNARINDADTLEVARQIDQLYRQLGHPEEAYRARRMVYRYEHLFGFIYET